MLHQERVYRIGRATLRLPTNKPWCHSKQTRVLFDPSLSIHAAMAMSLCRVIFNPALLFRRDTEETPEQPSMFRSGTCLRKEQNLIAWGVVICATPRYF